MKKVLIVGYGVVGKNMYADLRKLNPDIYDKYKTEHNTKQEGLKYDVAFVCVDTPYVMGKSTCDITEVVNAINETNAELFVIKSTVLPGTIERLIAATGKHIVFSPEYYGGTQHCNNFEFNFTIVGGDRKDAKKVIQLMQELYDARHTFHITDARTAELVKYMENSWLATKVSFCHQFYDIGKQIGVDYEELRELFLLDPRVNRAHTFVYDDHPYWDSHCLNKDVPAIADAYNATLLNAVIDFNAARKTIVSVK